MNTHKDKGEVKFSRVWAMPNKWTFTIKPIKDLLDEENASGVDKYGFWCDPFGGYYSPADITNDINPELNADFCEDALIFLKSRDDNEFDGVLFDPPYSTEQCLRRYTPKHGGTAGRAEYWAKCKDEIARIVKPNGKVISFGWDSNGCGKKRGFEITRVLLVCHGACHNDTIVTIEQKI